jgi:GT2 family glycosyltransferase
VKQAQELRHPKVRAVVLNHNGGPMTLRCLEALLATDWPADRLAVVLVDNASTDGITQRVRAELPAVRVIESDVNLGFAGGNNLALREPDDATYVALVNNDALVTDGWLAPLVATLEASPDVGAACPKILFLPSFREATLRSTIHRRRGDRRSLGIRLSGARLGSRDVRSDVQLVSGFWGPEHGTGSEAEFQWTSSEATVRVPIPDDGSPPDHCELRLTADAPTTVAASSSGRHTRLEVDTTPSWYRIPLGGAPIDVINNVGNVLEGGEFGADRGYLEPDDGRFDQSVDVFAWCGAAVLLRRDYLDDVGLFDERLFLYCEDLELSWRGRKKDWRYRYQPRSVVRHEHSATAGENSRLAAYYSSRNRLLVLTRHASRGRVVRSLGRELLVTASYARRDIALPTFYGRRVSTEVVRRRIHTLGGYIRLAPSMLASRWSDRGEQVDRTPRLANARDSQQRRTDTPDRMPRDLD